MMMSTQKSLQKRILETSADWLTVTPLLSIIVMLVGFSAILYFRTDNLEWYQVWRFRDVSEILQESYYTSIFMLALPMAVLSLCINIGVFQLNKRKGYTLYSHRIGMLLQIPATTIVVGLLGLTIVTVDSNWKLHQQFASLMFYSYLVYYELNALFFIKYVCGEWSRVTVVSIMVAVYFVSNPLVAYYCMMKWLGGRISLVSETEKEFTKIDPLCSQYEWMALTLLFFYNLAFCWYDFILDDEILPKATLGTVLDRWNSLLDKVPEIVIQP